MGCQKQKLAVSEIEATTNEAVIVEICYVLSSKKLAYQLTPYEIKERLIPILSLKGLKIDHKRILFDALNIYAEHNNIDFVDALNIGHMNDESIEPTSWTQSANKYCVRNIATTPA